MNSMGKSKFHPLVSVLGISMGDEGKGRVVHEILDDVEKTTLSPVSGVMKVWFCIDTTMSELQLVRPSGGRYLCCSVPRARRSLGCWAAGVA